MNFLRWLTTWAVFSCVPAFAASPQPLVASKASDRVDEMVKVRVWTVHATNKTSGIGDGLERIEKHLKNLNYSGFSLLSKDGAAVSVKGSKKFSVAGEKAVKVTVLERNEKRARVRVQVTSPKGKLLDTTVSIRRNGFFMVAGPKHNKGVLVLPIFARY